MSTRTPGENLVRSRKPSGPAFSSKKAVRNENNITQPTSKPAQSQKATLGSSTKPLVIDTNAKKVLKPKSSRPVLASLSKPNPNATPRPKAAGGSKSSSSKPDPQLQTFKAPSAPAPAPAQTPAGRTTKPGGLAPKSTKKAISVYTPAPASRPSEHEVEFAHPPSPPLQDGPPSPLRRMMDSVDDFGPAGTEDLDGMGIDPPPVMPHPTDLEPIHSPSHRLTSDFYFDQTDEYF